MNDSDLFEGHKDLLSKAIAFRPVFLQVDGKPTTALYTSQIYWCQTNTGDGDADGREFGTKDDKGRWWFWTTQERIKKLTGLSRHYQRKARESLRKMPWYHEEQKGMPAKMHFHIDIPELKLWLASKDPDFPLSEDEYRTRSRYDLGQGREGSSDKGEDGPRTGSKGARDQRSQTKNTDKDSGGNSAHDDPWTPRDDYWADEYGRRPLNSVDRTLPEEILMLWQQHVISTQNPLTNDQGDPDEARMEAARGIGTYFKRNTIIRELSKVGRQGKPGSRWSYFIYRLEIASEDDDAEGEGSESVNAGSAKTGPSGFVDDPNNKEAV